MCGPGRTRRRRTRPGRRRPRVAVVDPSGPACASGGDSESSPRWTERGCSRCHAGASSSARGGGCPGAAVLAGPGARERLRAVRGVRWQGSRRGRGGARNDDGGSGAGGPRSRRSRPLGEGTPHHFASHCSRRSVTASGCLETGAGGVEISRRREDAAREHVPLRLREPQLHLNQPRGGRANQRS